MPNWHPIWHPVNPFVHHGHNKPKEQETEIERTREDLTNAFSRPEGSKNAHLEFITYRNLRKVIDRDRLRKLLQNTKWYKEAELDHIYTNFLRIIGVLIIVQWPQWESFHQIFLDPKDPVGRPTRGDNHLPFIDVSFLEPPMSRRLFEWDQYIFCPIVIEENSHNIIGNSQRRLPFLNSTPVGDGASGTVTKVEVEKYQIRYTAGQAGGEPNTRTKFMARKIIESDRRGGRSYQTERRNLDLFKKGAATCSVILQNFASFVHGRTLNIIYPLADLDLHTFLVGNYSEFSDRAASFKPRHLLGQIESLASALQFMHAELYIDGQRSECAHLDLKPENVLVFWPPGRIPQNTGENNDPAGLWRISDFGLSVIRPRKSDTGRSEPFTGQRLAPGDIAREVLSRERSSMKATRGPGPWQPPEMQAGRVTKASDLWSFGCILATVLAFILGGPDKVVELLSCRSREGIYQDDYFYTHTDRPILKPEVLAWLNEQENAEQHAAQSHWIRQTRHLILDLLQIDRKARGTAEATRDRVSKIKRSTENEDSMWTPRVGSFQTQEVTDAQHSGPDDVESVASSIKEASQELPERNAESSVPDIDRSYVAHNTSSQPDIDHNPMLHRLRETSMSWPATIGPIAYARLETPQNTIQAYLSPNGKRAAFLSKARVFLFHLDNLAPLQRRWAESTGQAERISGKSFPRSFREFKPSEGRYWTSAILAGTFTALCSALSKGSDDGIVQIYDTDTQGAAPQDAPIGPREVDVPETCGDIKLSSKGVLLLMSDDHLDLHFSDGSQSKVSLSSTCQLHEATFTDNGDWLCAWYTTAKYYYWCIWDMKTRHPVRYSLQKYRKDAAPNQSSNFGKILVAFSDKPWFIACDQYGKAFVIRKRGDPDVSYLPELIGEPCDGVIAGAALPSDLGVIFVRRPDATANLRMETARVPDVPGEGSTQVRPWAEVERSFNGGKCGLSVTSGSEGVFVLTCHLNGSLARKKYADFY